ncbi:MAG: hypothetical protein MUF00_01240 [Gemmatimonadaceae bacterium]|jgi:photosystem II stability/assembly factor-like uncharacterized protein|nr:hypothetical protein [Gemmatimonadaceae bacterium]
MRLPHAFIPLALAAATALPLAAQPARLESSALAGLRPRSIGPAAMSGRVLDIAVNETDPYEFYVATAAAGVWKTNDNGVTWRSVFDNQRTHAIGAVTVDQKSPRTVWAGTGEATNRQSSSWGDGVYKSTDAGATWTNMGLRDSKHIARIAIDPTNSDIVFVASMGSLWGPSTERGIYRSDDGGRSWTKVLGRDEDTGGADVVIDPSEPNIVYAALYQRRRQPYGFVGGGPGSGLFKSTDGGRTWRQLTKGMPSGTIGRLSLSIYRKDPRVVYASVEQGLRYTSSISYDQRLAGIYRSDDKGESWRQMGDWNPRPAYSSQILVDPSDQARIYMVAYSFSDDSGKTFRSPRQTLHGDDRKVWVNPRDSRHVIKADDGGVGISYDRGLKWLYVSSLPISQFYRLSVSHAPSANGGYLVCGGLQDNGSWCAPTWTYSASGIVNDDWFRVGGGDGFFNVIDTTDNRTVYVSSQYLGLTRVDLATLETATIRPAPKEGEGPKLGNWGAPEPRVGQKIIPAGWNSPIIISPHDRNRLYAGMRQLWTSPDRGQSWQTLGDLTTGVDRRTLKIMGQLPADTTLSLDDGVSYFPTVSALSESPRVKGLLYVGTDDGQLQRSRDGGKTWTSLAPKITGLPRGTWVSHVEASRHAPGTVYAAFDGHQANDFRNYLYRSTDFGESWTSITGDLPAERVIHAMHEDPKNAELLYIGTEFGLFVSLDAGASWVEFAGLPRMPINDFTIHTRENDLVLATHARGIWVVDNLAALQELTPTVRASAAHLFSIEPAEMKRIAGTRGHAGDLYFRGQNPPNGALIDYWLGTAGGTVTVTVHDATGAEVATVPATANAGLNRVVWNLRTAALPPARGGGDDDDEGPRGPTPGRWVAPGRYTVRLTAGGLTREQTVTVRDDARLTISAADRRAWERGVDEIAALYRQAALLVSKAASRPATDELRLTVGELQDRIGTLYGNANRVTQPLTADQRAQLAYFTQRAAELSAALAK